MMYMNPLGEIDYKNPQEAMKKMANHIRYLQEQIEYLSMLVEGNTIEDNSKEV